MNTSAAKRLEQLAKAGCEITITYDATCWAYLVRVMLVDKMIERRVSMTAVREAQYVEHLVSRALEEICQELDVPTE